MRRFLAAWREFQDTVVRHPLCRYTILPAGIILSIWLVILVTTPLFKDRMFFCEGVVLPSSGSNLFPAVILAGGWLGCVLLTRRWIAAGMGLAGLSFYFFFDSSNDHQKASHLLLYFGFSLFIPLLLILYDWLSGSIPRLSSWMLGLCGLALAGFCGSMMWLSSRWGDVDTILIIVLIAGFFLLFFDLASRILQMPETALAKELAIDLGLATAVMFGSLFAGCLLSLVGSSLLAVVGCGFCARKLFVVAIRERKKLAGTKPDAKGETP